MKIGFNVFKPSLHSVIHLHVLSNRLLSITIDPQPHLYTRVTSSSQASAVLFSCFEFCCHNVWRHSSTDQWTQEHQQQTLTWSTETAVTARPLLIIVVLTPSWMLRASQQRGWYFLFKVCFFANAFVVFLPWAHSFWVSRHVLPRRHQTTDAGQVLSLPTLQ